MSDTQRARQFRGQHRLAVSGGCLDDRDGRAGQAFHQPGAHDMMLGQSHTRPARARGCTGLHRGHTWPPQGATAIWTSLPGLYPRRIPVRTQKNSKYSRISQSLMSGTPGSPEAADDASASSYRRISARFIMTR